MKLKQLKDPSLLLTPNPSFKCAENIQPLRNDSHDYDSDEEVGRVEFTCVIPSPNCNSEKKVDTNTTLDAATTTLKFRCRDQSVGFLLSNEASASDDQENLDSCHEAMDPNFFDTGYTLAGRTGFQIWAGSRVMMEILLCWPSSMESPSRRLVFCNDTNGRIEKYQKLIANGVKILELGSGVGVVGTSLAAMGGQVLMTDLPTLVDYSLKPNIVANTTKSNSSSISTEKVSKDESHVGKKENWKEILPPSWLGVEAASIHQGWASTTALDWTKNVRDQLTPEQIDDIRIIVSCDCVWLVSMLDGLLDSVATIFNASKSDDITFLMSFQRRDTEEGNESTTFTTVERVLSSVEARGWKLNCLAWRHVLVKGENDWKEEKKVFVFEIKP